MHLQCRYYLPFLMVLLLSMFTLTYGQTHERAKPFIVSTTWLTKHISDPELVLLHIGDKTQYDTAHIPTAQYLNRADISTPRGQGLTLQLPSVAQLDSVFEHLGISDNSHIVLYFGKDWISPTARVYLTLEYLGLGDRTSILDGGMQAWIAEGNRITREKTAPPRGKISPRPRNDVVVDLNWVKGNIAASNMSILDTRTPNFYSGQDSGMASRAGHIPGAGNLPFTDVVDEQMKFKDISSLRELFSSRSVRKENRVVTYCHIGQQASLVYFVARYLGYSARMYDGSFEEWSKHEELPIINEARNK